MNPSSSRLLVVNRTSPSTQNVRALAAFLGLPGLSFEMRPIASVGVVARGHRPQSLGMRANTMSLGTDQRESERETLFTASRASESCVGRVGEQS